MSSTNLHFNSDAINEAELTDSNETVDHQFLTFRLANEEYGIDIIRVQEIKGWLNVTKIPNTPDYITGVLNLRGEIVPVIDLRSRFKLEKIERTQNTVIIVLNLEDGRNVGVVVDAVSDVLDVNKEEIKDPPELGSGVDITSIAGLVAYEGKLVLLLDIGGILSDNELEYIDNKIAESQNAVI